MLVPTAIMEQQQVIYACIVFGQNTLFQVQVDMK